MKPDLYASRFHGCDRQRVKNQQAIEMFINHGGFLRPFRVILDSCLFEEKGFTQEMVRVLLQDPEARFYVTGCLQSEISTRNKFKGNKIPSIELDEIQLLRCNHELNTFDTNCIKKLLENYNPQKFVVVTSRPDFAQEIDNNLQCIVVFYRNSNVYLKPVSVFVKSVHHQILHDDYKRLKMRMQLFNLVESSVGIGGNTFFESLSQQLNLGGHQATRTRISVQLLFRNLYTAKVKGRYDTFLENVTKQETWPCEVVMQAAADLFSIRIVVLSGCISQFLMEWWPQRSLDTRNFRVLFFGYLEGLRYTTLSLTDDPNLVLQQAHLNVPYLFEKIGPKFYSSDYKILKGRYSIDKDDTKLEVIHLNRVKRRLKTYCFKEKPALGDGNCCPRSISYNIYGTQGSHWQVRREITEHLRNHPERYRDLIYDEYVSRMSCNEEWADDTFLQAAADLYDCRFTSIAPTPEEIAYDYYPPGFDKKSCPSDFFLSDLGIHNNAIYHDCDQLARRVAGAAASLV